MYQWGWETIMISGPKDHWQIKIPKSTADVKKWPRNVPVLSRSWGDYERAIRMLGHSLSPFIPEPRVSM